MKTKKNMHIDVTTIPMKSWMTFSSMKTPGDLLYCEMGRI